MRYRLVILHNPAGGAEREFNRWLEEDHVPALLAVAGIRAAQRLRLALPARWPAGELEHRYLTIYTIEACDIREFHRRLIAGKKERTSSPAVDRRNNSARYFAELGRPTPARASQEAGPVKRYKLVVLYNPVSGRDLEFNQWLDHTHVPDLLQVDGITSAERFRLAFAQTTPPGYTDHQYMTIYDIETDDIRAFHDRLMAGRANRVSSDTVDRSDNSARYFEVISEKSPEP